MPAAPAVAAGRPAQGYKFFAAESHQPIAAIATFNVDFYVIMEHMLAFLRFKDNPRRCAPPPEN
jgi:hypothetical protein